MADSFGADTFASETVNDQQPLPPPSQPPPVPPRPNRIYALKNIGKSNSLDMIQPNSILSDRSLAKALFLECTTIPSSTAASSSPSFDNNSSTLTTTTGGNSFIDFDVVQFAQHLCMEHWSLISSIRPEELLNAAWTKSNKHKTSPNVLNLINNFNRVRIKEEEREREKKKRILNVFFFISLIDESLGCD
jgi:hypothetical protein